MKELSEYISEQLKGIPNRKRLFDITDCMEYDNFTVEGLKLDFKNRTVKLDDTDEGIVFDSKPLEYKYNGMNVISIFKRTALRDPLYNRDVDGNPFIYALKGKNGWKLDMKISDVKKYMKIFIENCKSIKKKYDTCIVIPSGSSVNTLFMKELKKYMNCDEYVTKFFQKMPIDEVIMGGINHELIKKSNNPDKIEKEIAYYISNMKGDYFEAKMMRKDLLKYISYITYNEDEDTNIRENIDGKDILVLDDIISSGESVSQAVDAIKDSFIPKSVTVITLLSKKF